MTWESAVATLTHGESPTLHRQPPTSTSGRCQHLMSVTAKLYFGCGHPLLSLRLQGLKVCLEVASATSGAGFRIAGLSRDRSFGTVFFDTLLFVVVCRDWVLRYLLALMPISVVSIVFRLAMFPFKRIRDCRVNCSRMGVVVFFRMQTLLFAAMLVHSHFRAAVSAQSLLRSRFCAAVSAQPFLRSRFCAQHVMQRRL